ncbi:MarR family winged helix-turn-helix transcriptional regulator [Suttonella ornithocola]|uniref:Multiple antibiotic resistance protein marR n=1 Tax=Suttonella ornithocola TaxID=279832 RepID=A0A380MRQ0_9GAMM|nr:MarR family transcriptional regulator [Suttonella ornithocola]SUO95319.1 Multiple antibiotic resistance protein marR [Suttonella ornithocola]
MSDHVDFILTQWQETMPELDAEPMALIGRLLRCTALVQVQLEEVFASFGLTAASFDVLVTLRRSGEPYVLSPTDLFSALMVTSGTMTARLKNLESRGYICRLSNPEDARSTLVQLTELGRVLIEQVLEKHVENEKQLVSLLQPKMRKHLDEGLSQWLMTLEDIAGLPKNAYRN